MNEPALTKSHEMEETIISIDWNGDVRNPLYSVLVESNASIRIFSKGGESRWTLEGHQAAVNATAWCSPDLLVSISTDGELRQWTFRGSKQECLKAKITMHDVISIMSLPMATKNAPPRCAVLQSSGTISIVEPSRGVVKQETFEGCIGMSLREKGGGFNLITRSGGQVSRVQVDDSLHETGQRVSREAGFSIIKAQFVNIAGGIGGIALIDEKGRLVSWCLDENRMHVLEDSMTVSSAFVDQQTSTLFLGTKDGTIKSYPIRKNLSIGEKTLACDAHDFQVTALYTSFPLLELISGSMDGILKFHDITRQAFQSTRDEGKKEGITWRDSERLENRLRLAKDLIDKHEFDRAGEILSEMEGTPGTSFKEKLDMIKAELTNAHSKQELESEKHQKLLSYLGRIARDRGDILLDEICKDLGFSKPELVRTIKSLDDDMDWEFVEKYECLFLFKRERSITSMPVLEHHRTERRERRPGERKELQARTPRRNLLDQESRYSGENKQERAPRPAIPKNAVPRSVVNAMDAVKEHMKAAFLDKNGNVVKTVAVPDLIQEVEKFTGKIAYVVTDGIISPRLVEQSVKLDVTGIIGRRLHPNVDPNKATVLIIEFEDIATVRVIEDRQESRKTSAGNDNGKLEKSITGVLESEKWKTDDDIMVALDITDPVEQQVIKIKLKQLVTTRAIQAEMHEGKQYFKRVKERDQ